MQRLRTECREACCAAAQVLSLDNPSTAQWEQVPLGWILGEDASSAVVEGRLETITYASHASDFSLAPVQRVCGGLLSRGSRRLFCRLLLLFAFLACF